MRRCAIRFHGRTEPTGGDGMKTKSLTIQTDHAALSVIDSDGSGRPILLIHGNSSCKEVFDQQFADPLLADFRLIAFDLPGHGASENAKDPAKTYNFAGYADVAEQVLRQLGLQKPVVFGWSLGGHIALEMVGRNMELAGVMISGTPPIKPDLECLMAGFNIDPNAENLTGKRDFTDADAIAYATHTSATTDGLDPHLLAMCRRTDGLARELMFGSVLQGLPLDEREIVATMAEPLAILNGAGDPFIRAEYFDTLTCKSLWRGEIVTVEAAGHAPFRQQSSEFNRLLKEFAQSA
ncbi:alpha/beta fold hydrolase [Mesorhizobium sp. A556]